MGTVVGCDVSKGWIDAHINHVDTRCDTRIDNKAAAIERFVRGLPAGCMVGMEATGEYHELLASKLVEHGHMVFVINPRWIHQYAKSIGTRAKTDRVDAGTIARFVASEWASLHPYQPPSKKQRELRKLLLRRRAVVKLKMTTRQSLGAQGREAIHQFDRLLVSIERQILEIIRSEEEWRSLAQRLQSEPGVGPIVAAHLVQVLTRYAFKTVDAFVAHTGLDPRANDSGRKKGRRWLTHHGDSSLRTMLFMAAMTASKKGECREIYQTSLQKGLAPTAALVVLARKLARVAYGLFKSGLKYEPTRIRTPRLA